MVSPWMSGVRKSLGSTNSSCANGAVNDKAINAEIKLASSQQPTHDWKVFPTFRFRILPTHALGCPGATPKRLRGVYAFSFPHCAPPPREFLHTSRHRWISITPISGIGTLSSADGRGGKGLLGSV